MAGVAMGKGATTSWVAYPYCSSRTDCSSRLLIWAVVVVSGVIACGFTLAGAWLVWPFAGAEIAALWMALRYLRRHRGDQERIVRNNQQLVVERVIGGHVEHFEFHPYWARLRIATSVASGDIHLFIGSHGREVEIGRQLDGAQKKRLAVELRKSFGL